MGREEPWRSEMKGVMTDTAAGQADGDEIGKEI